MGTLKRYPLPEFLRACDPPVADDPEIQYDEWIHRKGLSLYKDDKERDRAGRTTKGYMDALDEAVCESRGRDYLTGERLEWRFEPNGPGNADDRNRAKVQLVGDIEIDHKKSKSAEEGFGICRKRTNGMKGILSARGFIEICRMVSRECERREQENSRKPTDGLEGDDSFREFVEVCKLVARKSEEDDR